MVAFKEGFSARTVAPMGQGNQMPVSPKEGWDVVITGSSVEPTQSDPTNGKLVLNMVIISGDLQGQTGDDNLNIFHSNPQTASIADQQLSSYCWAVNKPDAKHTEELYNIPFKLIVTPNKKDAKYVNCQPMCADGTAPGKVASGAASPAPQQQAAPPQPPAPPQAPTPANPSTPANNQGAWGGAAQQQAAPTQTPAWGAPAAGGQPTPPWAVAK